MKKLLFLVTTIIVSLTFAQDNKTFDLVISKLQNDQKAFEQFIQLGQLHCQEFSTSKKTQLFTDKYLILFNSFYPLPRLIEESALKKNYIEFQSENKSCKCAKIYSKKNVKLRENYQQFIKNKKSYHNNIEYFLEEDMKDYLKGYMIDSKRYTY